MALPKLNDVPKYDIVIPSTGVKTKFRPFLVKEEKVLLIAMESEDKQQMISSIMDTLEACVENVNRSKLTSFDIEYMFTKIRTKSVGETTDIGHKCKHCSHVNDITINLDKIELTKPKLKSNKVDLGNNIFLEMSYPTYNEILNSDENSSKTEQMFSTIRMCMKTLYTEEEKIDLKETPKEELDAFIESMSAQQLKLVTEFVDDIPKLKHVQKYNCVECKKENELIIEGFENFFA
jgi:DNA-directed RNA polymerase subunit RPC12/RpoP